MDNYYVAVNKLDPKVKKSKFAKKYRLKYMVVTPGHIVSTHRKKSAAIKKAKSISKKEGRRLIIRK